MEREINIVINTEALLEQLRKNKERFHRSFESVLKAYKKKSEEYQKKYAEHAQKVADKQIKDDDNFGPMPPPEPKDRTKVYDFYIDMLSHHAGETIEISETAFKALWKDKWDWTHGYYDTIMYYARAGGSGSLNYPSLSAMAADYADS
jgi:hypothetical protein